MAREYIPKDFVRQLKHKLEAYYSERQRREEALLNIRVQLHRLQEAGATVEIHEREDGGEDVIIHLPPASPVMDRMLTAALNAAWREAKEIFQPFLKESA